MSFKEIRDTEKQIYALTLKLNALRQAHLGDEVSGYEFQTLEGPVQLLDLFGAHDQLMLIHNMGQGCRYCTLWADGFNGLLPHLETSLSVVLVSKDAPQLQRQFANDRGWRFRLASHGGGAYMSERSLAEDGGNIPGVVVYQRKNDKVYLKNSAMFGPNDQFCSAWSLLSLAGLNEQNWGPQYHYWKRPDKMDDGGQNLND